MSKSVSTFSGVKSRYCLIVSKYSVGFEHSCSRTDFAQAQILRYCESSPGSTVFPIDFIDFAKYLIISMEKSNVDNDLLFAVFAIDHDQMKISFGVVAKTFTMRKLIGVRIIRISIRVISIDLIMAEGTLGRSAIASSRSCVRIRSRGRIRD